MLAKIRRIYKESLKPQDSLFNLYLARPPAAAVVALLAPTRVTPNQVTLLSLVVMVFAVAGLVAFEGPLGLWWGVVGVELSYVFDCVDGQLARVTQRSSPVGASFDFLMDELKAYLLVLGISARWALYAPQPEIGAALGLSTLAIVGAALAMTKFIRSPEYAQATGQAQLKHGEAAGAAHARKGALWPVEMGARLISQYPQTLPLFAVINRLDLFLWAYALVHLLYLAKTTLAVTLSLCRFAPPQEQEDL